MNVQLSSLASRHRGSALLSVILFTTVALVLVVSLLSLSLTERRLNNRMALLIESQNAAEALAEYGFSQLRQKFETRSTFDLDPSGSDALALPPASFWANSNVKTGSGDLELLGGTIQDRGTGNSSYYYVDPANPNNENDPLRGKYVWRRDVSVIAKATVRPPFGSPITSYASQSISVRGAPLFAHAIFYNMDLEIAPGPEMHIYGPVHANGNIYLSSQGGNSLNFHNQVTAAGHLYRAWKHGVGGSHGSESLGNGEVRFANRDGTLISMKQNNKWMDSRLGGTQPSPDFRAYASSLWNGNLLTSAHGISDYKPVAFGDYYEANPHNPSVAFEDPTKTPSNTGRLIIEPSDYPTDPNAADYATRMEIEAQKYANDAGIYIKVVPPTTLGGSPTITVTSRNRQDPSKNKTLTLPAGNEVVKFSPYKAQTTAKTTIKTKEYVVAETNSSGKKKYRPKTTTREITHTTVYGSTDSATTSSAPTITDTETGSKTGWLSSPPSDDGKVTTNNGSPSGLSLAPDNKGIYDRRRKKGVDLVDLDMDALRKAVAKMGGTSAKLSNGNTYTPDANDGFGNLTTEDWTGIVYVEIAGGPTTDPNTGATIDGAGSGAHQADVTALRIIKGKGKVPSYGSANEGLTIATNAPMYVQGHYNADGSTSTGSSSHSAHVPESGEVPAALVADAITVLSEGFDLQKTLTTNKPGSSGAVEISAALLMGLTPTNPTLGNKGESSGGAHNFPRFLENWNHATFIRGSLVALFESRIATEPWSTDYYDPPARNWGFNDLFSQGRFPPGTPRVLSYRRVDFTDLDAAGYEAAKASFSW